MTKPVGRFDENPIRSDVRNAAYVRGGCPNCGRERLEVYTDGPNDERAVGVRCEKCAAEWLLDPASADFFGHYSDDDPLWPPPPDNELAE